MTLNELLFDSLNNFESFKIDYNTYTKELTAELYELYYNTEVLNYYLQVKNNNAYMVIKLDI